MANDENIEESIEGLELEITPEEPNNQVDESNTTENNEASTAVEENSEEFKIQKKENKIKKILIIVVAALGLLILVGIILYFIGFFDPEPVVVKPSKDQKVMLEDKDNQQPDIAQKKKYQFKVKDIKKKRLNRKLSLLTKYEIIEEEIIEEKTASVTPVKDTVPSNTPIKENKQKDKKKETATVEVTKDKTPLEKNKNTIIEITQNKPLDTNPLKKTETKTEAKIDGETNTPNNKIEKNTTKEDEKKSKDILNEKSITEDETETIKREEIIEEKTPKEKKLSEGKSFLKFAQIATIKRQLYLSFLHQIKEIDKRISVCRNDLNVIQIFVGPFNNEEERRIALVKINQHIVHDAFAVDFTQEEFDKRCNF